MDVSWHDEDSFLVLFKSQFKIEIIKNLDNNSKNGLLQLIILIYITACAFYTWSIHVSSGVIKPNTLKQ